MDQEDARIAVIPANILWREEDGNTVLFNEDDGEPYILNETGSRIWELCNEEVPVHEILALLPQEFEGDGAVIQREAHDLIKELIEKKLLMLRP